MTALKFEDGRFENASVEFDEAALAPTYKLLWGVPGARRRLATGRPLLRCLLLLLPAGASQGAPAPALISYVLARRHALISAPPPFPSV